MRRIQLQATTMVRGMLQFALGLAILAALQHAGGMLVHWLNLPIPPAIAGMILLLALLGSIGHLRSTAQTVSSPLLKHMMLFFIPAVVGIMEQVQVLQTGWLPFVAACLAGAVLTLVATALTLEWLLARQQSRQ